MHALPAEVIRVALEDAPDAMLIVDTAGTIRFANQSVEALFGYPLHELLGRGVEALVPERFRTAHAAYREQFGKSRQPRAMGGRRLDLFGLRADGSEFPAEISLKPVYCEPEWLTVAAIRDVTNRSKAERELREAREEAERANLAKSRFLATASHDLRQPLQTLALLNGTLRRVVEDHPVVTEALAQQEQAIASMSQLLNGLLDISKLESGAVKPDPSDFVVSTLFEELRQEFAGLADSKGLSFKVSSCDDAVHSDRSLVGQILRNLVSNAIRYTRQGWVALRCMHEDSSFVRIEVLDSGVGIPTDQLRYIYDEFFQVGGSHGRAREGYGLGLSIVQRLVTLLGLKLDVQSEVGRGSQFVLTLPASRSTVTPGARIEARPRAEGAAPAGCILLVDDDAGVLNATHMLLKSAGYDVAAVASVAEALDYARHHPRVDLLLTDYHLGDGETGIQAIADVREAVGRPLKAVLITGDTSSVIQTLPPDPLMRIASKPINAEELLDLLRMLLAAD
jgi:two-component system, sensor histidine kinase